MNPYGDRCEFSCGRHAALWYVKGPCGPRIEPVKRDDGSIGWLVVHHSLDGREQHE